MKAQSNKTQFNIPKLRFPEFSGEWEERKFSDVYDFGNTNSLSREFLDYTSGSIYNIHYGDIHTKFKSNFYLERENVPRISEKINLSNVETLNIGDVVVADASEDYNDIGKTIEIISTNNQLLVAGLHTILGKRKDNRVAIGFMSFAMQSPRQKLQIMKIAQGVKVLGLPKIYFKNLLLKLPSSNEQQKIASFLTTVDEWIENLREQKDALEQYKKGMMQKIFSQEVRFKDDDGNEFPEWEEKKLGDVSEVSMGQSPSSQAYNQRGVGLYLIQGNADIKNRISSPRFWTSEVTKTCEVGDIILTVRAPSGYVAISKHIACIGRGVCAIKANNYSSNNFLYQFLLWHEPRWQNIEQGSTFSAISGEDIRIQRLILPSIHEQKKITDFLTSLDNLIESKQQQISHAEQWKQGLLQKMFV